MHFPPWTEEQEREQKEWLTKRFEEWAKMPPYDYWVRPWIYSADNTNTDPNTCPHCGKPL